MIGTHHAFGACVHASNETFTEISMHASGQRFGMEATWDHERIGQHSTIPVNPMRFIRNGIHHDVVKFREQHTIHQTSKPGPSHRRQALLHVVQGF